MGSKAEWEEEILYFPFDTMDQEILYQNQRSGKVRFIELTKQYREQLGYIAYQLLQLEGQDDYNSIKRILKK